MLKSFNLSEEQAQQVNQHTQNILRDRIAVAVDGNVLKEAKQLLTLKTEYLKAHGESLFNDIIESSSSKSALQHLPAVLNVMINEAVLSQH